MKYRTAVWVAVPMSLAAVAFALGPADSLRKYVDGTLFTPCIECPTLIDLGERELSEDATAQFSVANTGGSQLRIEQILLSCTCTGLLRREGDRLVQFDTLSVDPGQKIELTVQVSVRGTVGEPFRNVITFQTNDPRKPAVALVLLIPKVNAGVMTRPTSINFGSTMVGTTSRQLMEIRDYQSSPRAIKWVTSTPSDVVTVRLEAIRDGRIP